MNVEQYIEQYKINAAIIEEATFIQQIEFKDNGEEGWNEQADLNDDFREEVVKELYKDYTHSDKPFIHKLWLAEHEHCYELTLLTACFRQITFMLYTIATVEDIPMLMDAKLNTSFDASCGLDVDLMFPVDPKVAIAYYTQNPYSKEDDIVENLEKYSHYELKHRADYTKSWREYFGG